MKVQLFALAAFAAAAAPSVRLEPAVITSCRNGSGQAIVLWNRAGAAPVTLYAGESPMTGQEGPSGSVRTGLWVTDGLVFTLRDAAGQTLASATASVKCDRGGWWPLEVGNEWHFRLNNRLVTGSHAVWRVARKEEIDGVQWSVLDPGPNGPTRLRSDGEGRIYRLDASGREILLLGPAGIETGAWAPGGRTPNAGTLAGTFSDELSWTGPVAGLGKESGRLARGVGPTYYQVDVVAGSSGGFGEGLTLLEAVVGGARFSPDYPRIGLVLEAKTVRFGVKSARNCAIPCYFTACFGADLPTTYKPCIEVSVSGGAGKLTLLDPSGAPVFETPAPGGWVRIPLYREPATLLPAGRYTVQATVDGTTIAHPLDIFQ